MRIDVMKLQGRHAPVIAAEPAASSGLLDEDLLDLASPAHDCLLATAAASVVAAHLPYMLDRAVTRANQDDLGQPCLTSLERAFASPSARGSLRPQAISVEPMPHGRLASTRSLSQLGYRKSLTYQGLELIPREAPASRVPLAVDSFKPVSLHPVADRRRVFAKPPTDLRQREPLAKQLLQRTAIHEPHCHANICTCV